MTFSTSALVAPKIDISSKSTTEIELPPESIAKWYKPMNKRQVWLHNMFKLRRSKHAVIDYAANQDKKHLLKWLKKFTANYIKIGEMVPEWKSELDLNNLNKLKDAAATDNFAGVGKYMKKLDKSCRVCHDDYRAITVLLHRSPDFKKRVINTEQGEFTYKKYMLELTHIINRIIIAMADDMPSVAQTNIEKLQTGIKNLSTDCNNCHKQPTKNDLYFSQDLRNKLQNLITLLQQNKKKKAGSILGEVAVQACAICHGTHRSLYDVKQLIEP